MDAMAALLVRDASRFDVILATNAFGDILSDEASEISGSLGLAASINAGERARAGAGPAWLGARYRRPGRRQPGLADRLGGDAAGLARRTARRSEIHQGRRPDRARARRGHRQARRRGRAISAARSAPRRSASGSRGRGGTGEIGYAELSECRPALKGCVPCRVKPMAQLMFRCPYTNKPIRSGIELVSDNLKSGVGLSDQRALPALRPPAPRHHRRRLPDRGAFAAARAAGAVTSYCFAFKPSALAAAATVARWVSIEAPNSAGRRD